MSAKNKFECLLSEIIEISRTEPKIGSSVRHHAQNISIEAGAFGHDHERGCTERFEPLPELLEGGRFAFSK